MRTFIAIQLPDEIKDFLATLQSQLKKTGADVKWVAQGNIHLTLKFLGEIDDKDLTSLNACLETIASRHSPFQASLKTVGAFPTLHAPRVIWASLDNGDQEVKKIAFDLEEQLEKLRFPKEDRPFSSHITLGRMRSGINREKLVKSLSELSECFDQRRYEFTVSSITLFQSTLSPQGPHYEILSAASLKPI